MMEARILEKYDVTVVGGGVAGSVAARSSAQYGFKTLLIEKYKTPRNKPCSGIQFQYFEKLIGEKIPKDKLCKNELYKVDMITPKGKTLGGKIKMLNFWRSTFDSWLNQLAIEQGADFQDNTSLIEFNKTQKGINLTLSKDNKSTQITTRFLIGADGMLSGIRSKLNPASLEKNRLGTAINYYFEGKANLDPNKLYMYYNREFCPLMFAWVYLKDEKWVIGTGANENAVEYADRFYNHVKEKYSLQGKIVKKEGFASTQKITTFLGEDNILLAGDAAGLIDLYRGVGMDLAALSGRLAVKAIKKAEKRATSPIEHYQRLMKKTVRKLESNEQKQTKRYGSNESLEKSLSSANLLKDGLSMILSNQLNRILPAEKIVFLPT
jgi:geranylgeranyl reductase family protein